MCWRTDGKHSSESVQSNGGASLRIELKRLIVVNVDWTAGVEKSFHRHWAYAPPIAIKRQIFFYSTFRNKCITFLRFAGEIWNDSLCLSLRSHQQNTKTPPFFCFQHKHPQKLFIITLELKLHTHSDTQGRRGGMGEQIMALLLKTFYKKIE